MSCNDDRKALFQCELHFSLIITSRPLNHHRLNNQRINLLYNDVENKTSILTCCFCPKCVSSNVDRKASFLSAIHFSFIITRRSLNHQQTNKQHIILLYNEMKSVSFSAAAMVSTLYFQRKNEKHYISEIINFH